MVFPRRENRLRLVKAVRYYQTPWRITPCKTELQTFFLDPATECWFKIALRALPGLKFLTSSRPSKFAFTIFRPRDLVSLYFFQTWRFKPWL